MTVGIFMFAFVCFNVISVHTYLSEMGVVNIVVICAALRTQDIRHGR